MAAKPGIALQMYTLRELAERDFAGTLRAVAEIGYPAVQLQSYGRMTPGQLRGLLDELGLAVAGTHLGLSDVDGRSGLEILFAETDPRLVLFEPDVYWIALGGADPAAVIRRYAERCRLIHLKDVGRDEARSFAEVGEGRLDFGPIFAASEAAGAEWYVVEQDRCARPPLESVRLSLEHLRAWGKLSP